MTEQRLGILGGMGRPTRLAPCGDPGDLICSGQMNCPLRQGFRLGRKRLYGAYRAAPPQAGPQVDGLSRRSTGLFYDRQNVALTDDSVLLAVHLDLGAVRAAAHGTQRAELAPHVPEAVMPPPAQYRLELLRPCG